MRISFTTPFAVSAALRASRRWRRAPVRRTTAALASPTNGPDEVASVTSRVHIAKSPQHFAYDDDGNQTLITTKTGRWQVQYNGENRPIHWVRESDNMAIAMSYDHMGRRREKNDQRFFYDGYLQIANFESSATNSELPTSNSQLQTFIWDPTEPVATRPLVWQTNNCDYFYSHDGNKNVSEVVDAEGSLAAHYEYSSFGAVIAQHGELAESNPWRFSSEFADDVLGLMYYNYRHYEPVTGRWLLSDPIDQGEGEYDRYCFCMNNPASVCDRCGLYTLGDASGSLSQRGVLPLGKKIMNISITPGIGIPVEVPFYTQEQIFSEWLRMEQSLGNWWQSLPHCPRCICIVGGVPINPDPSIWKSPEPIGANAANHPGGVYEMRSQEFGHSANQCIYDQEGKVMLNMPTAGTVDYYAFPDNVIKHFLHDLEPFWYARDLGRIGDYYAVRPSW